MSTEGNDVKVECTDQPDKNEELTEIRKWISENMLLLGTLLGVAFGAGLGNYYYYFCHFQILNLARSCSIENVSSQFKLIGRLINCASNNQYLNEYVMCKKIIVINC